MEEKISAIDTEKLKQLGYKLDQKGEIIKNEERRTEEARLLLENTEDYKAGEKIELPREEHSSPVSAASAENKANSPSSSSRGSEILPGGYTSTTLSSGTVGSMIKSGEAYQDTINVNVVHVSQGDPGYTKAYALGNDGSYHQQDAA